MSALESRFVPVRGIPTFRARVRDRLGDWLCPFVGHRPSLVERHTATVDSSVPPVDVVSSGVRLRLRSSGPVMVDRVVVCSTCWRQVGD